MAITKATKAKKVAPKRTPTKISKASVSKQAIKSPKKASPKKGSPQKTKPTKSAVKIKPEACPRMKLNNGKSIPVIGLGTFKNRDDNLVKNTVKSAVLENGYRHIDTAKVYENEEVIGDAL